MPYCTNCGTNLDEPNTYCPECGEELPPPAASQNGGYSVFSGDPLPGDTRAALVGSALGIVVVIWLEVSVVYWLGGLGLVDDLLPAIIAVYGFNVVLHLLILLGCAYLLARGNRPFTSTQSHSGLSAQTKNAMVGVVVGNTLLSVGARLISDRSMGTLSPEAVLVIDLTSVVLVPLGVLLCAFVFIRAR